ncbi:MAG: hypothetical protein M1832_003056 [Thelocarpon impressellum]|nr:MAG: hypothetical protein M1832_003056 [Thelocarpon impressellum]
MRDPQPLASLSLTHVHYNPGDPVSYLCAWLALVPQGLCVSYVTLVWATREAEILLMFAGQLACEGVNWALKRYIKEERPKQMYGKGYGMPSSHAQFVAYFSVSLTLFLLLRHQPHPTVSHRPTPFGARVLLSLLALLSAAAVACSRVYLNYHTPRQVVVGSCAGAVFAIVWFAVTSVVRRWGLLGWALDTPVARLLRMRDLVVTEDLSEAGWLRWDDVRRKDGTRRPQWGAAKGKEKGR